jgi:hypothetical protein
MAIRSAILEIQLDLGQKSVTERESKLHGYFGSGRQQRVAGGDVKFRKGDVAFTGVAFTRASSTSITLHGQSPHI